MFYVYIKKDISMEDKIECHQQNPPINYKRIL